MAANDRPADIQWLVDNQTEQISGYVAKGREMGPPAMLSTDTNGNTVLMGPDGAILKGAMVSGAWFSTPSVFRLRITGTGSVTIDSRDSLGNITLAVASYTATSATDQIEFPYAGNNAVAIRATLTGTATVEVI